MDDYIQHITSQFAAAKVRALEFAENYNAGLPSGQCPVCEECGLIPGIPCPICHHLVLPPYGVILDTEHGYQVVAIADRRQVIFEARVDDAFD